MITDIDRKLTVIPFRIIINKGIKIRCKKKPETIERPRRLYKLHIKYNKPYYHKYKSIKVHIDINIYNTPL